MAGGELTDPVAYSPWWWLLAAALVLVVLGWYAGVTWWTRAARERPEPRGLAGIRRAHLARLDGVEEAVLSGQLPLRAAHQEISEVVRSYVAQVSPHDARKMSLEQLQVAGLAPVSRLVSFVYPPEFAPGDQGSPAERLTPALDDARAVVATWRP